MTKKISYIVSFVLLLVTTLIIIHHKNDNLQPPKHKIEIDASTISEIDSVIKNLDEVDSVIIKYQMQKIKLKENEKLMEKEKIRIKDSIIRAEKLKSKMEKLKLKERYEKQLDNIPNYRGGDIDTVRVELL